MNFISDIKYCFTGMQMRMDSFVSIVDKIDKTLTDLNTENDKLKQRNLELETTINEIWRRFKIKL